MPRQRNARSGGQPNGFVDWVADAAAPRVAVKDMISVKGLINSAGLPHHCTRKANRDADVVTRFKAAGYSIAGTTVSDNAGFGTMTPGVQNPKHPGRAVGGSSGGAAAAVAGGFAEVGLGTDTGGSVRIPAAYCDLFAFKASHGRVPMDGIIPLAPSFDALGLVTGSEAFLERAAKILVPDWRKAAPFDPRIAIDLGAMNACAPALVPTFCAIAKRLGVRRRLSWHGVHEKLAAAHAVIVCAEALEVHAEDWRTDPSQLPPPIRRALSAACRLHSAEIELARKIVEQARFMMDQLDFDILMSPTLPMPPARANARTVMIGDKPSPITDANIRLTYGANVCGLPVVVAPLGGMSIQFVGRRNEDERLLQAALKMIRDDA